MKKNEQKEMRRKKGKKQGKNEKREIKTKK